MEDNQVTIILEWLKVITNILGSASRYIKESPDSFLWNCVIAFDKRTRKVHKELLYLTNEKLRSNALEPLNANIAPDLLTAIWQNLSPYLEKWAATLNDQKLRLMIFRYCFECSIYVEKLGCVWRNVPWPYFGITLKGEPLTAQRYSVTINVTREVPGSYSGMALYGFKAVEGPEDFGKPVIWFKYSNWFEGENTISWSEQYSAYISHSEMKADTQIQAIKSVPIELGQKLMLNDNHGATSLDVGASEVITIDNTSSSRYVCGLSQQNSQTNAKSILCAFDLEGNGEILMKPIAKVLFMWASERGRNTGTVVEAAFSRAILVDLTTNPNRTIEFNTSTSWVYGVGTQQVPANASLGPYLIQNALHTKLVKSEKFSPLTGSKKITKQGNHENYEDF